MPWNSTWPIGSSSVRANKTPGVQNTAYIEITLNNDHYWNIGTNEDGRHKFVNMPKQAVDATISTGMDGNIYLREKTAAESPTNQDIQPYFRNASQVMQMLGIRACGVFTVVGGVVTIQYKHNISTIVRDSAGVFTATFAAATPTNNYLVLGDCVRNTATANDVGVFTMSAASTLTNVKSTALFKFRTFTYAGSPAAIDPIQCWFVVFGG